MPVISRQHIMNLLEIISILFIINEAKILWFIFNLLFQESEPISNYLSSEIPQEVKQRIARMGVDTLLKMVRYIFCWPLAAVCLTECCYIIS